MDVAYILGTDTRDEDDALRYSIQSIRRHVVDLGNVLVVGADPGSVPGCRCIPIDANIKEPWKQELNAVRVLCMLKDVTNSVMIMDPRWIVSDRMEASKLPFYAIQGADGGINGRYDYNVPCPYVIDRQTYLMMPLSLDDSTPFSPRSFYFNFFQAKPTFTFPCVLDPSGTPDDWSVSVVGRESFAVKKGMFDVPFFRGWVQQFCHSPSIFPY